MKTIFNLLAGIIFLINTSFANEINYKLNLTNINFTSGNSLEFDIYLLNAGESKEEFRYAMGQYFLDVNPKMANSGTLTYSIVKSELPESMWPSKVSVSGNQLRLSVNPISSDAKSFPLVSDSKPGLLIVRMKLETSADKFERENFELKWSDNDNNFKTKIVAYKDDRMIEVTNISSNVVEGDNLSNGTTENLTQLPAEFSLSQNYPNPFNPETVISYDLPVSSNVSLKVYDISGKEVMSLINGHKEAGSYKVTFNGSNFASGVYFYKITSGNFSAVKRMFLIK